MSEPIIIDARTGDPQDPEAIMRQMDALMSQPALPVMDGATLAAFASIMATPAAKDPHSRRDRRKYNNPPVEPWKSNKIARNAPCPCGSGVKYKRCCGAPQTQGATK